MCLSLHNSVALGYVEGGVLVGHTPDLQGKWTIPASSTPRFEIIVLSVVTNDVSVQEMSSSWIFLI